MTETRLPETSLFQQGARTRRSQIQQYAFVGFFLGLLFPVLGTLFSLAQAQLPLNLSNLISIQQTQVLLWIIDTAPLFLGFVAGVAGWRQDVLMETNEKLVEQGKEIAAIQANLEQRVKERTQELEIRNSQMTAVVRFAKEIARTQDPSVLLWNAVDGVSQQFGYDQVSIYLLDEQRRRAFLQASSSEAGKQQLVQGYFVAVGGTGVIGRAVDQNKPIQYSETGVAGSSAEIAIPLVVRNKVSGVLDIQSKHGAAFNQSEIEILQLLADQIATAMDNLRLLDESQSIVSELETLTSQQARAAWREFLQGRNISFQFTPTGVKQVGASSRPQSADSLKLPLILRGQAIGSIQVRRSDSSGWSSSERDLAEKIATQVSLALDNSRLLDETRQRALQEQTVNEISARLTHSLDVDALLQTAARELATLPEVAEVSVFVGDLEAPDPEIKGNGHK